MVNPVNHSPDIKSPNEWSGPPQLSDSQKTAEKTIQSSAEVLENPSNSQVSQSTSSIKAIPLSIDDDDEFDLSKDLFSLDEDLAAISQESEADATIEEQLQDTKSEGENLIATGKFIENENIAFAEEAQLKKDEIQFQRIDIKSHLQDIMRGVGSLKIVHVNEFGKLSLKNVTGMESGDFKGVPSHGYSMVVGKTLILNETLARQLGSKAKLTDEFGVEQEYDVQSLSEEELRLFIGFISDYISTLLAPEEEAKTAKSSSDASARQVRNKSASSRLTPIIPFIAKIVQRISLAALDARMDELSYQKERDKKARVEKKMEQAQDEKAEILKKEELKWGGQRKEINDLESKDPPKGRINEVQRSLSYRKFERYHFKGK